MGLDLTLLPFDSDNPGYAYSHSVLDVERRYELFDAIEHSNIVRQPVPITFTTYMGTVPDGSNEGEWGYGATLTTPYGDALTYCTVKDLLQFSKHEGVLDNRKNKAVWAYLRHLDRKTKVALYWH